MSGLRWVDCPIRGDISHSKAYFICSTSKGTKEVLQFSLTATYDGSFSLDFYNGPEDFFLGSFNSLEDAKKAACEYLQFVLVAYTS